MDIRRGCSARPTPANNLSLKEGTPLGPRHLSDSGPSGSRPEEQTPKQTDEATFAKQLANALFAMKSGGEFDHLVLAADPQTLGQLRSSLHATVTDSVVFTLDKELTNHSVNDVAKIVRHAAE